MPPSTSSSEIRSDLLSPSCGLLADLLSILVTSTGRFGVLPVTASPVNGQSAASLVPPETGWESGVPELDLSSPPPQAASVRLSARAAATAATRVDRGKGDDMRPA